MVNVSSPCEKRIPIHGDENSGTACIVTFHHVVKKESPYMGTKTQALFLEVVPSFRVKKESPYMETKTLRQ